MTKRFRVVLASLLTLVLLLAIAVTFTIGWRPFLGPRKRALTTRQFVATPERLARGRYLTQSLLGCEMCHTPRDWTKHGAPAAPGMELAGQVFDMPGLPGRVAAPNLTPDESGSKGWTDDQIARSIREGIGHDERTIFPIMPYDLYRNLSDEDLAAVVLYVRSVAPVRNIVPPTQIKFPVNYLIRSAPQPVRDPVTGPSSHDPVARGKYMVTVGCGCHNAVSKLPYAGGEHLEGPWGSVTSPNITPDPSGIGYYDEGTFIKVLRTGYVGARELKPIMPYGDFQYLTDEDMKAMFAYLRSVPPVRHRVDNTLSPTYCKLCKQKHGAGDQN